MTLSDKPGPSLSFSHKDYSLKVYTRERRRKEGEGKRRRIILIFFFLFSFFFGKHYKQPAILSGLCAQISLCFSLLSLLEPHWTPQRHCPWLGKWQITSAIAASQGTAVPSSLPSSPLLSSPLPSSPLLSSPLHESPHLISNSGIKASASVEKCSTDCTWQLRNSEFYVHTRSGFVFLEVGDAERGSITMFPSTTSFVRI